MAYMNRLVIYIMMYILHWTIHMTEGTSYHVQSDKCMDVQLNRTSNHLGGHIKSSWNENECLQIRPVDLTSYL